MMMYALHSKHDVFLAQVITMSVICVVAYAMFVYVLCAWNIGYPFQPEYLCNYWQVQISKDTGTFLSPNSMCKTLAPLPWMEFEPTTSRSKICVPPIGIHRSLQIWKRLTSINENGLDSQTLRCSFPVVNIFTSRMFIQHSWLATLQVSNCWAERAWKNHEVMFSVNSQLWSSWQLHDHFIT